VHSCLFAHPHASSGVFTDDEKTALIALRRELHRFPELSWREKETARRLEAALRHFGVTDVEHVADTGLIARIPGTGGGATIAVRGDIDALPIEEATGLPYSSERRGVMHACGHDIHATWAAGAAVLLSKQRAAGDVLVVFQPAEEVGEGARAIVASGALEGVQAIFGGHVDRRFQVGEVVADAGPLAASADTFEIVLTGRGAHGARPQESADPIVGAAALIGALQTIVSRRLSPAAPGVVTVGTIQSGTAPNIIPETATLTGTVRATDPDSRQLLNGEAERLAQSIAGAYRLTAKVTVSMGTPPLVNGADAAGWAREAAVRVLGPQAVVPLGTTNMGGEDFAVYLEHIPGAFMRIGAREPGGERHAAHSPRFYAAEESIFVGAAVLAEAARVASAAITRTASSGDSRSESAFT
jgi:amidohydrolase